MKPRHKDPEIDIAKDPELDIDDDCSYPEDPLPISEFACSVTEDDVQVNGPRDPNYPHPGPHPPGSEPPEGDPY